MDAVDSPDCVSPSGKQIDTDGDFQDSTPEVTEVTEDNNDDTDEDCQKDPPEALDDNSPYKTYTYVSF